REGQVGIAAWVAAAQFNTGGGLAIGIRARHADQRLAVDASPVNIDRRLVAWHQPLVGIDERRENRAHGACMGKLTGDKISPHVGESVLALTALIDKGIAPGRATDQLLMSMHTGAVQTKERLGHEGRVKIVARSNSLE